MILYHGTVKVIRRPDVSFSKNYLDFGRGFYLTTYKKQAEKWAKRKALRQKAEPIVNVYELPDDLQGYKMQYFDQEDEKWLDFVCACRKGEDIYQDYDIIIGGVADDDVFKTIDMYLRGIWNKDRTLQELRYYKKNNQICIVNQKVLDTELKFQEFYRVMEYDG